MLGNNNGNQQKEYTPTVFSKISLSNKDGNVDQTRLTFSYWSGLLKISIAPNIQNTNEFDSKNAIAIHLSVPKAYIFLKEIEKFEEERANGINTNFFYGVDTPKGLIGISNGKEFGYPNSVVLSIRRMQESEVISTYAYEFKGDQYYYAIRNFDEKSKNYDSINDYGNTELVLLKAHLRQYIDAMTMAQGYACVEANKFQENNTFKSLNQIKQALGIKSERKTGTGDFFRGGGSVAPRNSYGSLSEAIGNDDVLNEDVEVEL